mmetsp:Transcript_12307/g.33008  ORF Transcript_12307/g.33008 Transcript_12307/m.33008 type:complete len:124 (-) Transcript_12307:740-1111(-)
MAHASATLAFRPLRAYPACLLTSEPPAHLVPTAATTVRAVMGWQETGNVSVIQTGQAMCVMTAMETGTGLLATLALTVAQTDSVTQRPAETAPMFVMKEPQALFARIAKVDILVPAVLRVPAV